MAKKSAGILVYRFREGQPQILLVHPGGPFWAKKDAGAWSVPKGEYEEDENPLDAAKREFKEELGIYISGDFIELSPVKQKSGKVVQAWAIEKSLDIGDFRSNTFSVEWPPRSGKFKEFPEVDKAQWFAADEAKQKINPAQVAFIDELMQKLPLT
ncbi:MAG: NUDIX domain-containing protein [Bacteroidetes bacterium]|nr:NUDIX domain-containing protein [Bacteroidota bacterium]